MKDVFNAWLSPDGKLLTPNIFWENSYHAEIAFYILQKKWNLDFTSTSKKITEEAYDATEMLEKYGYIRLQTLDENTHRFIVPFEKELTNKQKNTILDWCKINNMDYDKIIKYL